MELSADLDPIVNYYYFFLLLCVLKKSTYNVRVEDNFTIVALLSVLAILNDKPIFFPSLFVSLPSRYVMTDQTVTV